MINRTKGCCFSKMLAGFFVLAMQTYVCPAMLTAQDLERSYLQQQLLSMARFSDLQGQTDSADQKRASVISSFVAMSGADEFEEEKHADILTAFCQLAFSGENNSSTFGLLRVLQVSGRIQFASETEKSSETTVKHFSGHVKEAIVTNKARAKVYEEMSRGETRSLSRLYTSLEYSLLPLANIFDRWALNLNKLGIPALVNDFVPMHTIPAVGTKLLRAGAINNAAAKVYSQLLQNFRSKVYRAAAHKDFLLVQMAAIEALHGMKQLEVQHNCNLSLSIHLVESVGLAARNADNLSRNFAGRSDNFYRAFIIAQTAGLRLFSTIDIKAQKFHQQGIGIITNDLPAIPFP